MKKITAIFKKDVKTILLSPSGLVMISLFSVACGLFLVADLLDLSAVSAQLAGHPEDPFAIPVGFNEAVIAPFFVNASLVLSLIIPIFASRLFSEEKRSGAFELLFAYPVSDSAVVCAKFLTAAFGILLLMASSMVDFLIVYFKTYHFEIPVLTSAYLGIFLAALLISGVSMAIASRTANAALGSILSFSVLILWWGSGWFGDFLAPHFNHWLKSVWIVDHLRDFSRGVLNTSTIAFYLIGILFFFFACVLSLESRNWKR